MKSRDGRLYVLPNGTSTAQSQPQNQDFIDFFFQKQDLTYHSNNSVSHFLDDLGQ